MKKVLSLLFLCFSSTLTVISQDAITWNGWTHDFGNYGTVPVWLAGAEGAGGILRPYTPAQIRVFLGQPSGGETWQSVIDRNSLINSDNKFLLLNRSAVDKYLGLQWQTNGDNDFFIGQRETGDRDFHIYNYGIGSTNLILKRSSGNVGIGTMDPAHKLDVNGNIFSTGKIIAGSGVGFRNSTYITNAPNPIWSFENSPEHGLAYYQGSAVGYDRIGFHFGDINNPPFYIKNNGSGYFAGDVLIGTTAAQKELLVNGSIKTRKVTVTQTNWADYVFDSSYQLAPLHDVKKYITQNKHLPDVPSAATVKKEGIDLGDNQAILLKKIEELTLYIIAQNEKLEEQGKQIKALQEKIK